MAFPPDNGFSRMLSQDGALQIQLCLSTQKASTQIISTPPPQPFKRQFRHGNIFWAYLCLSELHIHPHVRKRVMCLGSVANYVYLLMWNDFHCRMSTCVIAADVSAAITHEGYGG